VVDLFDNADRAGASRTELAAALTRACARPREFTRERLREMAKRYGTKATQALVEASSARQDGGPSHWDARASVGDAFAASAYNY
jgi:hypothetical protein